MLLWKSYYKFKEHLKPLRKILFSQHLIYGITICIESSSCNFSEHNLKKWVPVLILFEIRLFSDHSGKRNTVIINLIEFKRSVLFKSFEESIILNETC